MRSLRNTSIPLFVLLVATYVLEVLPGGPYWRPHDVVETTYEAAKDALEFMKDWAIWMAGIQVATLGAVAALAKDGALTERQKSAAIPATILNTVGLLFTAWTLSSIPSLLLRMSGPCKELSTKVAGSCDFYELPFMDVDIAPRFAFFSIWQHWLWAAGLCAFLWLAYTSISTPARKP
ncbi:hypothetical protein GPA19_20270 [Azoarcus indigens]|uniref:hypothetical protein n=1 Tax=Azoarcus indigens TaxID=29545 RepID=UPI0010620FB7|nr:hypothetical protein [Azoarcus indigens]NMG67281.1 hypothetical protein [Azoarcus indigens]